MLLVAAKGSKQFYINEDDAEGFKAAGYELFKQELVPVGDAELKNIKAEKAQIAKAITATSTSETVEPIAHDLEEV